MGTSKWQSHLPGRNHRNHYLFQSKFQPLHAVRENHKTAKVFMVTDFSWAFWAPGMLVWPLSFSLYLWLCVYHFQQMATQILTEKAKLIREHPPYPPPKYKHTHTLCSPSSPPPTMEDVSVIPTPCFSGCIDWVFLSLSWICYLKSDCWLRKSKVMWKLHDYLVIKIKWKLPLLIFLRKYNWVWL